MFPIPWYVSILVSFPENILIIIVGFALFNIPIKWREVLIVATVNAIVMYYVRQLPIVFGLHTLISVFTMAILMCLLSKIKFWLTFMSVLTGFVVAGVIVSLYTPVFFSLTSTSTSVLESQPIINIIYSLPEAVLLAVIYIIVKKYRFYIYDFGTGD